MLLIIHRFPRHRARQIKIYFFVTQYHTALTTMNDEVKHSAHFDKEISDFSSKCIPTSLFMMKTMDFLARVYTFVRDFMHFEREMWRKIVEIDREIDKCYEKDLPLMPFGRRRGHVQRPRRLQQRIQ